MVFPANISLNYPEALILGLALGYLFVRHLRRRNGWRWGMLLVLLPLLGYPLLVQTTRGRDLYLLVDRSRSISEEGQAKQREVMELVDRGMEPGDRIAVVSFNAGSYLEQPLQPVLSVGGYANPHSADASDLNNGLASILDQSPANRERAILVLSDGEYTGQSPMPTAHRARQAGVPIYYRNLQRLEINNLAVRQIQLPDKVLVGEPYRVGFHVLATSHAEGSYRILRDNQVVGAPGEGWRSVDFEPGDNTIAFADVLDQPGIHRYEIEVRMDPPEREPVRNDNQAARYVQALGERPILLINRDGAPDNVSSILSAAGLDARRLAIGDYRLDLGRLSGYRGVILNNVPVLELNYTQLRDLRNYVVQEGGGLLVTGGSHSFAAGGYYKSALDEILPVSLEDRNQTKKVASAFSITMDRSGSMAVGTPSGVSKMELANQAAVECIRLLAPVDSVSVIAVDSIAHTIVPQSNLDNPAGIVDQVLRIESMGGGIFIEEALVAAGHEVISAPQANKHILLFADANDSEQPGSYRSLLKQYRESGITVSVVGLGTSHDADADLLREIAELGGGEVYFTESAEQLVQFFTADTINYTRNSFIEEPVAMAVRAGAWALAPDHQWRDFVSSHYNLLFPRDQAQIALQTTDEDQAPILAHWQKGLGRVATLALAAEGPFADHSQYGDILLSSIHWIAGSEVEDSFLVDVGYAGTRATIRLEVSDEERKQIGEAVARIFTPSGEAISHPLHWEGYNRLSVDLPLTEQGLYRGVIDLGERNIRIGPISLPVSPEFLRPMDPDFGRQTLARIASITGGGEVLDLGTLWQERGQSRQVAPLIWPFLVLFLILFLLDVAEERFALQEMIVSKARWAGSGFKRSYAKVRSPAPESWAVQTQASVRSGEAESQAGSAARPPRPAAEDGPEPVSATAQSEPSMDYLTRSKKAAHRHFGKKEKIKKE